MDEVGENVLTAATFALQKDGDICRRPPLQSIAHSAHDVGTAKHDRFRRHCVGRGCETARYCRRERHPKIFLRSEALFPSLHPNRQFHTEYWPDGKWLSRLADNQFGPSQVDSDGRIVKRVRKAYHDN